MKFIYSLGLALMMSAPIYAQLGTFLPELKSDFNPSQQSGAPWELSAETDYLYDHLGNIDQTTTRQFIAGNWQNTVKFEYAHNDDGTKQLFIEKHWFNEEWMEHRYHRFAYNAARQKTSEIIAFPINDNWGDVSQIIWTYNNQGQMTEKRVEEFDNGQWIPISRETSTYNAEGQMATVLTEKHLLGNWQDLNFATYHYEIRGLVDSISQNNWVNGSWVNGILKTFVYNENEAVTLEHELRSINGEWISHKKKASFYGPHFQLEEEISYQWENGGFAEMGRSLYTYDLFIGTEELTGTDVPLEVFPNPAQDKVVVAGFENNPTAQLILSSMDGRQVGVYNTQNFNGKVEISLDNLANGIYLINEQLGSGQSSGRMARLVVQH